MHRSAFLLLPLLGLLPDPAHAQAPAALPQWHHLDPVADKTVGISTERAYALLRQQGRRPVGPPPGGAAARWGRRPVGPPVIVAVIDGGIDTTHADLKAVLWHNPGERPANGRDDDHDGYVDDGYVDDVYGWNFTGGPNGYNVFDNQKEATRVVARLRPRYAGKTEATVPKSQLAEFRLYQQAEQRFTTERRQAEGAADEDARQYQVDEANLNRLKQALNRHVLDTAALHHPATADTALLRLAALYYPYLRKGFPNTDSLLAQYRGYQRQLRRQLNQYYGLEYNPQPGVGDHPTDLQERLYGTNNLLTDPNYRGTVHGTHCAGIIGADRTNGTGVQGVADHVRLLAVRAIPMGDERDKDVANAIRYAVDHGAKVISMSFAKYLSPDKAVVDEAVRYAGQHGVLLVHGAANDHLDIDRTPSYPSGYYLDGGRVGNLLTVGASTRTNDEHLAANFSNYGPQSVDVFAPGQDIISTKPNNSYMAGSGTSAACPVVAGVAAVLKTYFPQLTPADLKRIIMASAKPLHTQVLRPGSKQLVDFATLSRAGGVVNLYEAVRIASQVPAVTVPPRRR